jgi:hypothetical protein
MAQYDNDDDNDFFSDDEEVSDDGYDDEDLEDGFSESDYEVDEVFESLIGDLTDEQLEELNQRLTDHLSR